jgi:ferredoxin--NADP+ reductase
MAQWINGRVVDNKRWGGQLFSLRVDAEIEPFRAGQFSKLGLPIDGEIVSRPYSLVNAPDERPLDFYIVEVPDGPLSSRLAALQPGQEVLVAPHATGVLTLAEVPEARHLWMIATGAGLGPFLSIIKTEAPWQRFERVVLVHGVRRQAELNYQDTIMGVAAEHPRQFTFMPFVSREPCSFALPGRVSPAIADGRLERRAGITLNAADSQVMLCGNPQMTADTLNTLIARGLKKNHRRDPGQVSLENYW